MAENINFTQHLNPHGKNLIGKIIYSTFLFWSNHSTTRIQIFKRKTSPVIFQATCIVISEGVGMKIFVLCLNRRGERRRKPTRWRSRRRKCDRRSRCWTWGATFKAWSFSSRLAGRFSAQTDFKPRCSLTNNPRREDCRDALGFTKSSWHKVHLTVNIRSKINFISSGHHQFEIQEDWRLGLEPKVGFQFSDQIPI